MPGTDFPPDICNWTSDHVASFIRMLGKAQCWTEYAKRCTEVDVDGSTLLDSNMEVLVELGFHKIHANKVLASLRKLEGGSTAESTSPVEIGGFPTGLPLTDVEVRRMQLFGDHHDLMNLCEDKITEALDELQQQRSYELERSKKAFDQLHAKVVSERIRCREEITTRHEMMTESLNNALEDLRKNKDDAKREAKVLYRSMQISDWSRRADRMKTIISVTRGVLQKVQPMLVSSPSLTVEYNAEVVGALESEFFKVSQNEPEFDMRSTLESAQQRVQREENERKEAQRKSIIEAERKAAVNALRRKKEMEDAERKEKALAEERQRFVDAKRAAEEKRLAVLRLDSKHQQTPSESEGQRWSYLPPMRSKRRYLGVAISKDGSRMYAVGGYGGSKYLNSIEYYDFSVRTWRSLPPMREKRCGLGVAMSPDGRFLYAVGGYDGPSGKNYLKTVEVYDFQTGRWAFMPPMNTPRAHLGVVISPDGRKIYAVGGFYTTRLKTVEVYNMKTRKWTMLPDLSVERSGLGVALSPDGNTLYAMGGYNGTLLNSCECLDVTIDRKQNKQRRWLACVSRDEPWTRMPPMNSARRYLAAVMSPDGKRIYVMGGDDTDAASAEYFDVKLKQWHQLPNMRLKRKGLGAAISPDGRTIYAVGGHHGGDAAECLRIVH
mmetsp:Transcript_12182/g.24602  ORF Transcript_12182/g.24602 Transcript_12182/m.24602 type:complete len:663 (+) Transcript_12182:93-2081(+)|eukprot:CAMPEP_0167796588 /NCGR_PEP_ID=MMETSP0111_2-20121227/15140_1 /TAXON_ID=91324 /ORGANISM="Lotharella globosa, Strain CCCM811" /LENGTH=662 /DNA_ID=CAMNT_0007690515 /DNA_START=76 /DNA_END=2064 /DNA_ORIENTATION=-